MSDADTRRAVIYARQSLTAAEAMDDSLSIASQVRACRASIAQAGWREVGIYEDPDQRGWRVSRPAFDRMLTAMREGRADVCVVFKLSRFMRSLMDQERFVGEIADAGGELVSVAEPYISTSPLVRQILGAVNEQYKRDQSEFMRAAWAERAQRGLHHGGAPYGYRMVDGMLQVAEPAAQAVRDMFGWALDGHGAPEIAHRLNQRGVPVPRRGQRWHDERVLRLLRRPVYCGRIVLNGAVVNETGQHDPLIPPETFDAVQAILDRRRGVRRKASPSWLDGFVWHTCGVRMYAAQWAPDARRERRWRFRCGHATPSKTSPFARCERSPKTIFADIAEAAMRDQLVAAASRIAPPAVVTARLEARHAAGSREREAQRCRMEQRCEEIGRQRDRLLDMTLAGTVDEDVYQVRDAALKDELARLQAQLAATPAPVRPDDVAARHDELLTVARSILVVAEHEPAALPPLLHRWDARLIVGAGAPRLGFGEGTAPYFAHNGDY